MISIRMLGTCVTGVVDDSLRYWVAGNPSVAAGMHTGVDTQSRRITRDEVEEKGSGWARREWTDKKNEGLELTFSTTINFPSAVAAWQWMNSWSRADSSLWPHPLTGDAVMRILAADGSFVEEYLDRVFLRKPKMMATGSSVVCTYTLSAGFMAEYRTGTRERITVPSLGTLLFSETGGSPGDTLLLKSYVVGSGSSIAYFRITGAGSGDDPITGTWQANYEYMVGRCAGFPYSVPGVTYVSGPTAGILLTTQDTAEDSFVAWSINGAPEVRAFAGTTQESVTDDSGAEVYGDIES